MLPDGCSDLIFHQPLHGTSTLRLVGVMTTPLHVPREPGRHVALRLHPHAAGALLQEASVHRDLSVDADTLWGRAARQLHEQLGDLSDEAAAHALQAFVGARLRPSEPRVMAAVAALEKRDARVEALASTLGVSSRQFTRLFTREVGVSPRTFLRTARLQRTLPLLRDSCWALVEVAALGGFSDQAHLTREWVALTRMTPAAWRSRHVRNLQDRATDVLKCSEHVHHPELSGDDRP